MAEVGEKKKERKTQWVIWFLHMPADCPKMLSRSKASLGNKMPPGMACSLFSLLFQERQFVLQPMYQVSWRFMWERRARLARWLHSKAHGACYIAPQTLPCQKQCCLHWCGTMQQCAPFLPLSRNILSLNCTCTCCLCAGMHVCKLLQCALPW